MPERVRTKIFQCLYIGYDSVLVLWIKLKRKSTHKELGQKSFGTLLLCSKWKKVKLLRVGSWSSYLPKRVIWRISFSVQCSLFWFFVCALNETWRKVHKEMGQYSFSTLLDSALIERKWSQLPERIGTKIFQHFLLVLWMKLKRRSSQNDLGRKSFGTLF